MWGRPPPAKPGLWAMSYHDDWEAAHPDWWSSGRGAAGSFYARNVWVTGTPEWDRQWFREHGMGMPRRWKKADMGVKPGELRIASVLMPGESAVVAIDPETGTLKNLGVRGGRPHEEDL